MPVSAAPTYEFSVEEYLKLGEAGIFHKGDRVELLDGDIVVMSPIGVRHMNTVRRLLNRAAKLYGELCLVDAQNPLVIDGRSMPQPDLLLLRLELDESAAPGPADVLLLVEVAESSLVYDQRDKLAAYARNGICEYWIVDLTHNEVQVYRDPESSGYRTQLRFGMDEAVAPLAFPETPLRVQDILPR